MPLIDESYDSLPYIDPEPTPAQRDQAESLITAELSTLSPSPSFTHALLPPPPPSNLSPLLASEFARIASKIPISGIDLSRYEAIEPPSTSPHSDVRTPETLEVWRAALQRAYTSQVYLSGRTKQLGRLSERGKEDWLLGNEELVAVLRGLEMELAEKKELIDRVVVAREGAQRAVEGELRLLEEGWKKGVGKVLETEVAAESLRKEALERRRAEALRTV